MPTKFRLPSFLPSKRAKVVEITNRPLPDFPASVVPAQDFGTGLSSILNDPQRASLSAIASPETPAQIIVTDTASEVEYKGGHHEQAQDSEISFNYRLSALERFASESAKAQADAGLPRMNVEAPDELPIESQLRARAAEIFIDWKSRAIRKTQDALQKAVLDAGNGVVNLRHAIDHARLSQFKVTKIQNELQAVKAQSVGKARTVAYDSHLPKWAYVSLVVVLAGVEWIANVPIFRALLPVDAGADRVLKNLSDDSENVFWAWGGIERLIAKITVSPEAGLLAIGAITILLYLTHVCGESRRRLVAFKAEDDPGIAHGMVSEVRQAKNAFWQSLAGIIAILLFLSISRALISGIAKKQYDASKTHAEHVAQAYEQAKKGPDTDKALQLSRELRLAQSTEQGRSDNLDYAATISTINPTIVLLNVGLVLVAVIAAYQRSSGSLTEIRISDPAATKLQADLDGFIAELMSHRHRVRTLDLEIQTNIGRARYLSTAKPTESWRAKAERLNSVVLLFRATNATIRGIDPQNILAFQSFRAVEISSPEPDVLIVPQELAECEGELGRLRTQLDFLRTDLLPSEAGKEVR